MSSEKQIAANRANAARSTGPNTNSGKARSRMNAWKHGLRAEKVVIAGEDAEESLLVERLAHYAWRMRRAVVFEAALKLLDPRVAVKRAAGRSFKLSTTESYLQQRL